MARLPEECRLSVEGNIRDIRRMERMARLPQECRLSVERRIRESHHLELTQDHNVFACFPIVSRASDTGADVAIADVPCTHFQTAESLNQVLRLISFHWLKESSIPVELAMWRSRFDENLAREDCRIPIPVAQQRL